MSETNRKRKTTDPPDGYVCHLCKQAGHWIQQCSLKTANKNRRRKSEHIPVAGVDPSPEDMERAREMQKVRPPACFCGIPSRLKKVKRSHEGGDNSRALGKYFFFCSKAKYDVSACRFARPVEDELTPKKERVCSFWSKSGTCKKGDKCIFRHDDRGGVKQANKNGACDGSSEKKEGDAKDGSDLDRSGVGSSSSSSSSSSTTDTSNDDSSDDSDSSSVASSGDSSSDDDDSAMY